MFPSGVFAVTVCWWGCVLWIWLITNKQYKPRGMHNYHNKEKTSWQNKHHQHTYNKSWFINITKWKIWKCSIPLSNIILMLLLFYCVFWQIQSLLLQNYCAFDLENICTSYKVVCLCEVIEKCKQHFLNAIVVFWLGPTDLQCYRPIY